MALPLRERTGLAPFCKSSCRSSVATKANDCLVLLQALSGVACQLFVRSADLAGASACSLCSPHLEASTDKATGEKQGFRVSLSEKKDPSHNYAAPPTKMVLHCKEFMQCRGQAWFACAFFRLRNLGNATQRQSRDRSTTRAKVDRRGDQRNGMTGTKETQTGQRYKGQRIGNKGNKDVKTHNTWPHGAPYGCGLCPSSPLWQGVGRLIAFLLT